MEQRTSNETYIKHEAITNKYQEIDKLLLMFHDFQIIGLEKESNTLKIETHLPWGEMWDIDDYKMTFLFYRCNNFKCHYWKRTSNELKEWEKGAYYPSEEHVTTNLYEVLKLELDVQSHDFKEPDIFFLNCDSSSSHGNQIGQIEFGRIELNASNYQIFNNEMNEIKLDKMKSWRNE
ncbi:hypothetical protein C9994_03745 [Marivirga lumbricoides]|uniref:Uncharacterized protein n=1 Tax=Marivirga lumbricoides TaxID=1046115 RepID=A0A2T4DU41_9BACT|nr:hypothetical protein C9994_03745 [Marivirga lumbricoides]